MNIDERLEKLVERHEALSLNVELLEKQVETTGGQVRAIAAAQLETDALVRSLARHMADVMDTINRLAHVAEAHDGRLDHLESN
jgi:hypothetical protein